MELNELNFHFIKKYTAEGKLPGFNRFLQNHVIFETVSESGYPYLEPWIQWPTVYTGLTYDEHRIFRLGDAVYHPQLQIWEKLEATGATVGAISPMNAVNACKSPDFFLPDPWTNTEITADPRADKLFRLIRDVVNNNASAKLSTIDLGRQILPLAFPYLSRTSISRYLRIMPTALKYKWAKACILDSLLADLFLHLMNRHHTDYGSLFLNAGAHIQHHHMFESKAYEGDFQNPSWYSTAGEANVDPLLFIYEIYDGIVSQFLARPDTHLMITTGLSQVPNSKMHYQYRIVDFEAFMAGIGIVHATIKPRMSRDFLLAFSSSEAAQDAAALLASVQLGGKPLFSVEDRGDTLFCQVAYYGAPEGLENALVGERQTDLREHLALVSIENGIHQTIGYHFDSHIRGRGETVRIPLTEVHQRLMDAVAKDAKPQQREPVAA
ncbi:hypothetical protein AQZ52_01600 [Novosphingobium fuchskuhlense]|uniref:Uncharacterized protein n=1 Tax=Novosphingobium fuchskuhlense TaxID=1117702 RepID=A0A117UZF3_9SPHN|nr:hypothetical protein AQZ52_01600 [Novosphingobium fuchskuhlense]